MFSKVLDTQMVNFYEFSMAQELLSSQPEAAVQPAPPAAASTTPR
jgi:hypothetical protein